MSTLNTREVARERVFMFAQVTTRNSWKQHRVRIRDLSALGLRAEGEISGEPGDQLEVDFGAAGKARGEFAWRDGNVFGVKFKQEIEPDLVRRALIARNEQSYQPPRFVRGLSREKGCLEPIRKV